MDVSSYRTAECSTVVEAAEGRINRKDLLALHKLSSLNVLVFLLDSLMSEVHQTACKAFWGGGGGGGLARDYAGKISPG